MNEIRIIGEKRGQRAILSNIRKTIKGVAIKGVQLKGSE